MILVVTISNIYTVFQNCDG